MRSLRSHILAYHWPEFIHVVISCYYGSAEILFLAEHIDSLSKMMVFLLRQKMKMDGVQPHLPHTIMS